MKLRARFKQPFLLVGLLALPLLIGATAPSFVVEARLLFTTASAPFLEFQEKIASTVRHTLAEIVSWPKLKLENHMLRAELGELKNQLTQIDETKKENARLKSLLALKENSTYRSLAARTIAHDPSHWTQYIVINKGAAQGVSRDTVLVHSEGLVGKVVSAGTNSARAILLIDHESRVSAINEVSRDVGLIEGTGTPYLKMTYLDKSAKIQVGDTISSSGLGGIYPKGIPIGQVHMIGEDEDHEGIYAVVKPFVPFSKLEELLCISSRTDG